MGREKSLSILWFGNATYESLGPAYLKILFIISCCCRRICNGPVFVQHPLYNSTYIISLQFNIQPTPIQWVVLWKVNKVITIIDWYPYYHWIRYTIHSYTIYTLLATVKRKSWLQYNQPISRFRLICKVKINKAGSSRRPLPKIRGTWIWGLGGVTQRSAPVTSLIFAICDGFSHQFWTWALRMLSESPEQQLDSINMSSTSLKCYDANHDRSAHSRLIPWMADFSRANFVQSVGRDVKIKIKFCCP